MSKKIALLGLQLDDLSMEQAINTLLNRPAADSFAYVVTPNSDHFARLRKNQDLQKIYSAAFLCLLDSQFLWKICHALHLPKPGVITGTDLAVNLLSRLDGQSVAVIGLGKAAFIDLQAHYPCIHFLHHLPPMELLKNPAAFASARDFAVIQKARFTFIALGSPLQEILAAAIAQQSGATGIALCTGAALAFCAGHVRRAPLWMRRAGLEWLHRLAREPLRLGRRYILDDPPVLLALLAQIRHRT
jgi:exopolysaccharide biosynthesis WecB/TagA/CpsF family protein